MIWFGRRDLRVVWNLISQSSPVPAYIAPLSYQSISTPSKWFAMTKSAKSFAVLTGSLP